MNLSKNQLLDILCFIIGPVLIAFNLFDFSSRVRTPMVLSSEDVSHLLYYYYKQDTQVLLSLGVALVCWGFLRIYWKKKNGTRKN